MKKILIPFSLLILALISCNNRKEGITGTWNYLEGLDTAVLVINEQGHYTFTHNYVTHKRNTLRDSGTFKLVEGDIYEFTPLVKISNGRENTVKRPEKLKLTLTREGNLELQPGEVYKKLEGDSEKLVNSSYYTMIPQGEYNNAFEKYVFKNDSLIRYRGYSQTEEIADSLWYPDMMVGLKVTPRIFTSIRTAPNGQTFTEEFSYSFINGKLFFGKAKEGKVFNK